jgi:hypothetical protein
VPGTLLVSLRSTLLLSDFIRFVHAITNIAIIEMESPDGTPDNTLVYEYLASVPEIYIFFRKLPTHASSDLSYLVFAVVCRSMNHPTAQEAPRSTALFAMYPRTIVVASAHPSPELRWGPVSKR